MSDLFLKNIVVCFFVLTTVASAGTAGRCWGVAGNNADLKIYWPIARWNSNMGRETEGGGRGAGTMAGSARSMAVPRGCLQQLYSRQGTVVVIRVNLHLQIIIVWVRLKEHFPVHEEKLSVLDIKIT